jgi:hypothetical protein
MITSTPALARAATWRAICLRAGVFLLHRRLIWWLLGLLGAFAVTVPAWLPWLDPRVDLWLVDDAKNHMLRIYVLEWMIRHGAWYPRWVPDLYMGYGYPVFNFYAPVFYYLALALRVLLRLDIWDAFRATGVVAALVGASGCYALTVTLWRRRVLGVLAAAALLYGPYAFQINFYKRGAIPEALGLAMLPWLLLAVWRLWFAVSPGAVLAWTALTAMTGAAAILIHNLTALTAAATAAVWTIYLLATRPARNRLVRVLVGGLLAPALAGFFWLPALWEGRDVQLERLQIEQLDFRPWLLDMGGNTLRQQRDDNLQTRHGPIDLHLLYPVVYPAVLAASPKASLSQAGLAVLAAGALLVTGRRRADRRQRPRDALSAAPATPAAGATLPLLLVSGVCLFLTFRVSEPIWEALPALRLLQFPWRLMGPLGVCVAVAGAGAMAGLLETLERRWGQRGQYVGWVAVALVVTAVIANGIGGRRLLLYDPPLRTVDGQTLVRDEAQDRLGVGTTSGREFLPREVEIAVYTTMQTSVQDLSFPRDHSVFERLYPEREWVGGAFYSLAGDLRFLDWRVDPMRLQVRVANDSPQPGQLGVRQLRFAGWRAWLDGQPVQIGVPPYVPEQQASLGFMVITVPPGEHTVRLAFGPTVPRLVGMALSAGTVVVATIALCLWVRRRQRWPVALLVTGSGLVAAVLAALIWRGTWAAFGQLVASPLPAGTPGQGVWQASHLDRRGAGLLVNVAEAARMGQARIASPSGPALGPERFVDVRQLTVRDADDLERGRAGTSRRQWLYLHPPSEVSVDVRLPARSGVVFQASLALDPATWVTPVGDGVRYRVAVSRLGAAGEAGPPVTVLDQVINPRAQAEHRRWVPVEADLSHWAGSTVRLTLQTEPRDELSYDWSGWGNPVVAVSRETARQHLPRP